MRIEAKIVQEGQRRLQRGGTRIGRPIGSKSRKPGTVLYPTVMRVRITCEDLTRIKARAVADGVSESQVMRTALTRYFSEEPPSSRVTHDG